MEARLFWKQQVAGSIPVIQTIRALLEQRWDSKSCLVGSIPTARAIYGAFSLIGLERWVVTPEE